MSDPAKHTASEIRYEVRIIQGPRKFSFRSETIELDANDDMTVLVRMTIINSGMSRILDEKIVGIIGSEWRSDARELLNLREFLNAGGVIGLDRDLVER